jgi:hypothetical protein
MTNKKKYIIHKMDCIHNAKLKYEYVGTRYSYIRKNIY